MKQSIRDFLQCQIDGGFGIREIARETGVAASTISRIANGKVSPDIDTTERILKMFGCELSIVMINEYLKGGKST